MKMIIELICEMDFAGIFASDFEIAFLALFLTFLLIIETFLSIILSKLIVESFAESIIFGWSIGIWFSKRPKKPPEKYCISNSNSIHLRFLLVDCWVCMFPILYLQAELPSLASRSIESIWDVRQFEMFTNGHTFTLLDAP